jgi:hypothetical protein
MQRGKAAYAYVNMLPHAFVGRAMFGMAVLLESERLPTIHRSRKWLSI